jgi:hypothetical protein
MEQPTKDIKYFVLSTISQLKKLGLDTSDYFWLLEIATTFFSEKLRTFNAPSLESTDIEINLANRVWSFPSDLVAVSRVAYKRGNYLWDLTADNSIDFNAAPTPCEQPNYVNNSFNVNPYWYYDVTWINYGAEGARNRNYYRVDHNKRQIVFAVSIPVGLGVVEYISAGKDIGESTLVPLGYADTFRKYLIWKACEFSGEDRFMRMAKDFERQYNEAMWDSNIIVKSYTPQELTDAINRGTSFTLK